jgi:predicted RNase H-like HicB family nuclease
VYIANCPALEGCYTQGDTYEKAMRNIRDVIQMCLEELKEEKKKIDPFHDLVNRGNNLPASPYTRQVSERPGITYCFRS